jgi:hypothetical protein
MRPLLQKIVIPISQNRKFFASKCVRKYEIIPVSKSRWLKCEPRRFGRFSLLSVGRWSGGEGITIYKLEVEKLHGKIKNAHLKRRLYQQKWPLN